MLFIMEGTAVSMLTPFLKETKQSFFLDFLEESVLKYKMRIIQEFERKIGKDIEKISVNTLDVKRLRSELLVRLKDWVV